MVPSMARIALVINPDVALQYKFYVSPTEAAAPSLGVEIMEAPVRGTSEIEPAFEQLSRKPNIALIIPRSNSYGVRAVKLILESAARDLWIGSVHGRWRFDVLFQRFRRNRSGWLRSTSTASSRAK